MLFFSFRSGRLALKVKVSRAHQLNAVPVYPLDFAASSSSRNEIHNVNSKLIPRTVQAIATESRLESINLCELVVPGKLFFSFLGVGIGVRWGKGTKLNL